MSHKVLVVEDEPAIADNIKYVLSTDGFGVIWCATGGEAMDVLQHEEVDLVVLDIGLPDRNGFEICKDIRRQSGVPVVFLTARSDEVDKVVGLEIGGDDYIVKPFSPRELAARVRAILRRVPAKNADEGGRVVSTPFEIDKKRMKILYFGRPLDLSRYEYKILEVLINRPGWVFSRDKLMDLVWEEPGSSLDRTVDTHIKTLRGKLRDVRPEFNPIRTHRGMGYSLEELL